jgi:hypothetical protein
MEILVKPKTTIMWEMALDFHQEFVVDADALLEVEARKLMRVRVMPIPIASSKATTQFVPHQHRHQPRHANGPAMVVAMKNLHRPVIPTKNLRTRRISPISAQTMVVVVTRPRMAPP